MEVAFIFASCPPGELLELRRLGYRLASTADCQGVEKVDNVELAKRLKVGHMTWEKALDFLKWAYLRAY